MKWPRPGVIFYRLVTEPRAERQRPDWEMRRAASRIRMTPQPKAPSGWPVAIMLTGAEFWHQTVFCARSFELAVGHTLQWEFHNDGTLSDRGQRALARAFPRSQVISAAEIHQRLERTLPRDRFPALRASRDRQPMMRKLTDLRAGRVGPSLYLDSDILFFSAPTELIDWMNRPEGCWFLHDGVDGYPLPPDQLEAILGSLPLERVNAGLLALDATPIDWKACEAAAVRAGDMASHVLFEQTLTAHHLTRVKSRRLPPERYTSLYSPFTQPPDSPMLHYCWNSKADYRAREWRRFMQLRALS